MRKRKGKKKKKKDRTQRNQEKHTANRKEQKEKRKKEKRKEEKKEEPRVTQKQSFSTPEAITRPKNSPVPRFSQPENWAHGESFFTISAFFDFYILKSAKELAPLQSEGEWVEVDGHSGDRDATASHPSTEGDDIDGKHSDIEEKGKWRGNGNRWSRRIKECTPEKVTPPNLQNCNLQRK